MLYPFDAGQAALQSMARARLRAVALVPRKRQGQRGEGLVRHHERLPGRRAGAGQRGLEKTTIQCRTGMYIADDN